MADGDEVDALASAERDRWLGIGLAVTGNVLISFSLNIQKYAHNSIKAVRDEASYSYLRSAWWWAGLAMMVLGEVGNFAAYGFAPAAVVSPLGAVSVIANAVIASQWLGETLRRQDLAGLALAVTGGIAVVLSAPAAPDEIMSIPELEAEISRPFVILFVAADLAVVAALLAQPREELNRNVLAYVAICSLLGSITVMCSKAISTALRITFAQAENQFRYPLLYALILVAAASAITQVKYLNEAMIHFGTSEVVPIYYVMFTLASIAGGLVLYREWAETSTAQVFAFLAGTTATVAAVYLISAGRPAGRSAPRLGRDENDEVAPAGRGGSDWINRNRSGRFPGAQQMSLLDADGRARLGPDEDEDGDDGAGAGGSAAAATL